MQLNALDPGQYLAADEVINHHHPDVAALAARLAAPTLIKMLRSRDHLPPPGPGVIPTGLPVG